MKSWRLAALVVGIVVGLALPAFAQNSFTLPETNVTLQVSPDGSVTVTESVTYDFSGSFSGAYREIPVRAGEAVLDVSVSEAGQAYSPGACTDLGCSSPAGTFGTRDLGGRIRVVWHYSAFSERRTFQVRYRFVGLAKAYDDVVDVNVQVWGSEWEQRLSRLTASMGVPGDPQPDEVLVWGHPSSVAGNTSLGADSISPGLEATNIPAGQFVEFRVVFPRRLLESTVGATVVAGSGGDDILEEERREAESQERQAALVRTLLLLVPFAAVVPAGAAITFLYLRYGREPRVDYDREYEQEPPSELPPAEVGALLSQGRVDERQFTATLFDLIRKGVINSRAISVDRSTWMGLRKEEISDLELSMGDTDKAMTAAERDVLAVVTRALDGEARPLHEFRKAIREDASANASSYQSFRSKAVSALTTRHLIDRRGRAAVGVAAGVFVVVAFVLVLLMANVLAGGAWEPLIPAIVVVLVVNGIILAIFGISRRATVRRTPDGGLQAARWSAFRRYLRDFSRLEEAPPIALALWDRLLVYAISFGVAEEVLEAARLHAPQELEQNSSLYWFGHHGYTGGSTENAFAGITSALSGAFTPPSSSGGGGGFSGSGGGGGGGGGGGAW